MPESPRARAARPAASQPRRDVLPRAPAAGPDDAELVRRARSGDRWAHEAIFRRYVKDVARIAERLLRRRSDADDVVQDTFAAALTSLDRLEDPAALRSWLIGIAVFRVKRRHRTAGFLRMLGLDRGLDDATLSVLASDEASPEARAELRLVDQALASLSQDERIAWMLRHVEGEKLEDVAAMTGCSLATAKRRIAAADARVRRHVEGRAR